MKILKIQKWQKFSLVLRNVISNHHKGAAIRKFVNFTILDGLKGESANYIPLDSIESNIQFLYLKTNKS